MGVVLTMSVCAVGATPNSGAAQSYKLGDVAVGHIWAPPPETEGLPVYGPILNRGTAAVRLVGTSTPIAEQVRFRKVSDGGAMWLYIVELRSGKPLALAPWREHIWLSGLRNSLKDGDTFDLTLNLGSAGTLKIKVPVEKSGGH